MLISTIYPGDSILHDTKINEQQTATQYLLNSSPSQIDSVMYSMLRWCFEFLLDPYDLFTHNPQACYTETGVFCVIFQRAVNSWLRDQTWASLQSAVFSFFSVANYKHSTKAQFPHSAKGRILQFWVSKPLQLISPWVFYHASCSVPGGKLLQTPGGWSITAIAWRNDNYRLPKSRGS